MWMLNLPDLVARTKTNLMRPLDIHKTLVTTIWRKNERKSKKFYETYIPRVKLMLVFYTKSKNSFAFSTSSFNFPRASITRQTMNLSSTCGKCLSSRLTDMLVCSTGAARWVNRLFTTSRGVPCLHIIISTSLVQRFGANTALNSSVCRSWVEYMKIKRTCIN